MMNLPGYRLNCWARLRLTGMFMDDKARRHPGCPSVAAVAEELLVLLVPKGHKAIQVQQVQQARMGLLVLPVLKAM